MILTDAARIQAMQGRMDQARPLYEEAVTIERPLAEQNPSVYRPALALILSSLARVEQIQNRIADSRAHYTEALTVLQQLAQQDNLYASQAAQIQTALNSLPRD
jgi:tetratricopeptide (TPR) repeat protein